jgi:hypothetical protein
LGNSRPCPLAPGGESLVRLPPVAKAERMRRRGEADRTLESRGAFFVPAGRAAHCSPHACIPTVSSPVAVVVDAEAMDGGSE